MTALARADVGIPRPTPVTMRFTSAALTDAGRRRSVNEDCYFGRSFTGAAQEA